MNKTYYLLKYLGLGQVIDFFKRPHHSYASKPIMMVPNHISNTAMRYRVFNHNSKLYIVEWGGLAYKQMAAATNANTGLPTLTLRSLEWKCKNSNNSLFQQRTTGTVVTAGKTFVTTVQTVKSDIECDY